MCILWKRTVLPGIQMEVGKWVYIYKQILIQNHKSQNHSCLLPPIFFIAESRFNTHMYNQQQSLIQMRKSRLCIPVFVRHLKRGQPHSSHPCIFSILNKASGVMPARQAYQDTIHDGIHTELFAHSMLRS